MHLQSLDRFDFESGMLLYNYQQMQIPRFGPDFNKLADLCHERNVALQTFQSIAWRPLGKRPRKYKMYFYEPLEAKDAKAPNPGSS